MVSLRYECAHARIQLPHYRYRANALQLFQVKSINWPIDVWPCIFVCTEPGSWSVSIS